MPYVAIVCLATFIAFIFVQAYRRRLHVLSMPFIAAGMFAYLYVISPLTLMAQRDIYRYVTERQIAVGVWVPLVMLVALYAGWVWGRGPRSLVAPRVQAPTIDHLRVYRAGLALSVFGGSLWLSFVMFSGGLFHFYSRVHGSGGAWSHTTAYHYSGLKFVHAGLALMVAALCRTERGSRWKWGLAGLLAALVFFHGFLMGSRGSIFRLIGATLAAYILTSRKRPSVSAVVAGGIALGLFLLLLPVMRGYTPLGRWDELSKVDWAKAPVKSAGTGNEFTLHTGVLATVNETGKHGLGERYVWYHLFQPVPRLLWPGKPYSVPTGTITAGDMRAVVGWVPGRGSAAGNVGSWYREWGMLSLLVWGAFGYLSAAAYRRARAPHASAWWIMVYSLIVSGSCHMIAQGFLAFWQAFLLQTALAYVVWRLYVRRLTATEVSSLQAPGAEVCATE